MSCYSIQFYVYQFNIYCIKYSHIYSNTVTKKNHEFSEEVNAKKYKYNNNLCGVKYLISHSIGKEYNFR